MTCLSSRGTSHLIPVQMPADWLAYESTYIHRQVGLYEAYSTLPLMPVPPEPESNLLYM